jgi:hypothetical protein
LAESDEADIHRDASLRAIAFIWTNLSRSRGAGRIMLRAAASEARGRPSLAAKRGKPTPAETGSVNAEYN